MASDRDGPGAARAPLSERVCDAATLGFALWTLCCHAIVAAAGSLTNLLWTFAAASLVGLGGVWWARGGVPEPAPPPGPASGAGPRLHAVDVAIVVLALLLVGFYAPSRSALLLWWGSVALLAVSLVAVLRDAPQPPPLPRPRRGRRLEALLWLTSAAAVGLVAIIYRSDMDTAFYVGLAVAAVDEPQRELMLDPIYGVPGLPLHMPAHRVHAIELLTGALSYLTRLPAFVCLQWMTALAAAALVPLAFARLFRILTPRHWLASVWVLLAVLLAAGGSNWYGNFAFVRMLHGKSVYLSVFLPLAWAYGLHFGARPTRRGWLLLFAVQVAAVGCSSTALWSVPIAAGLGAACSVRLDRRAARTLALAVASSIYVVSVGLLLRGDMAHVAAQVEATAVPGADLSSALARTLGGGRLEWVAWASVLCAGVLQPPGLARRFATLVPLAILLLVLDPFFVEEVQRFATGPSYRRAMWVLPVPILMTLAFASPLWWIRGPRWPGWAPGLVVVAILSAYGLLVPSHGGLSEENKIELGWPRRKAAPSFYEPAARLAALTPPGGAALAPPKVAVWLPSIHHHPPLVHARDGYLGQIERRFGKDDAEMRMRLSEVLSVPSRDLERRTLDSQAFRRRRQLGMSPALFEAGLRRFDVRGVALNADAELALPVRSVLARSRFDRRHEGRRYEIWVRETPWQQ